MAYYAISRAMKPIATGISRKLKVDPRPNLQHEAFCKGKTKADAASVIAHATPHIYPQRNRPTQSGSQTRDVKHKSYW